MPQFRKKPVVIEATQWFLGTDHPGVGCEDPGYPFPPQYFVTTIHEQRAYLAEGDWILPEPKPDRFYPCKPDIFAATYEPVEDSNAAQSAPWDGPDHRAVAGGRIYRSVPPGSDTMHVFEAVSGQDLGEAH